MVLLTRFELRLAVSEVPVGGHQPQLAGSDFCAELDELGTNLIA